MFILTGTQTIDNDVLNQIPQQTFEEKQLADISVAKVIKAVNEMKNNKAADPSLIPAEVSKARYPLHTCKLLLQLIKISQRIYQLICEMP